jgi:hypothetical protein
MRDKGLPNIKQLDCFLFRNYQRSGSKETKEWTNLPYFHRHLHDDLLFSEHGSSIIAIIINAALPPFVLSRRFTRD